MQIFKERTDFAGGHQGSWQRTNIGTHRNIRQYPYTLRASQEFVRLSGISVRGEGHLHVFGSAEGVTSSKSQKFGDPTNLELPRSDSHSHSMVICETITFAGSMDHSILMVGPPGTGKSMLAQRLPGLLPPMDEAEALASAALQGLTPGGFDGSRWRQRPVRSPHHSASAVALVGGGVRSRIRCDSSHLRAIKAHYVRLMLTRTLCGSDLRESLRTQRLHLCR